MDGMEMVPILIADDDEDDRLLALDALEESRLRNPIFFVEDGKELLEFLRNEGPYRDKAAYPRPGLILLDLNMPRMDGKSALQILKADPRLKNIPVVVLTTSEQDIEVSETYALGANSYIVKPVQFSKLVEALQVLGRYWLSVVRLPTV